MMRTARDAGFNQSSRLRVPAWFTRRSRSAASVSMFAARCSTRSTRGGAAVEIALEEPDALCPKRRERIGLQRIRRSFDQAHDRVGPLELDQPPDGAAADE